MHKIDIGIFAHNEAGQIAEMITGLSLQDIFIAKDFSIRVLVLANGCTDQTVEKAQACSGKFSEDISFEVVNLPQGGKSRTWNEFVHKLSRQDVDTLVFCDADAVMPNTKNLSSIVSLLLENPKLRASTSNPIKDISYYPGELSLLEKIISKSGGTLYDWRNSIAGSLYALPVAVARGFHLPIGLPVEDGFVRAMVATRCFQDISGPSMIDGNEGVFHIYESERTIRTLIRHQTRLVIGSAINAAIYGHLNDLEKGTISEELERSAHEEDWLEKVLAKRLPNRSFGWVPWSFLYKRLMPSTFSPNNTLSIKLLGKLALGFAFDVVVYVNAQIKMARGAGVGYW